MSKKEFSFLRLIQNDYIASLSVLFPVIFWGITVFQYIFKKELSTTFLIVCSALTAMAIIVLLWRRSALYRIFEEGIEVIGTINEVAFSRDRGFVSYVYTYQGQKYVSRNYISKTERTKSLQPGEQINLVLDRENPKKAFIRELYE